VRHASRSECVGKTPRWHFTHGLEDSSSNLNVRHLMRADLLVFIVKNAVEARRGKPLFGKVGQPLGTSRGAPNCPNVEA